jgi:hypothetical protein
MGLSSVFSLQIFVYPQRILEFSFHGAFRTTMNVRARSHCERCDMKDLDAKLTPIGFSGVQLKVKSNSDFLYLFQGYFPRADSEADSIFSVPLRTEGDIGEQ